MDGWGRRILIIAAIGGVLWFLRAHRAGNDKAPPAPSRSASGAPSKANACIGAAEKANSMLHESAMLLLRPPVDASAWSSAEGSVSSAISDAESACSGGETEGERKALGEARTALGLMKTTLGDLSQAAKGGGGAMDTAARQGEIDAHLDSARAAR